MSSPRYFLGIDGGQSSTVALIAGDSGHILGRGVGGPCNHTTGEAGRHKFFAAVTQCLEQACRSASLDTATVTFEAACLGFSGGAADKEAYSRELIRSDRFAITHDAEIALRGATAGAPGIIIIAGTGSMAFGSNTSGRTARAGGWGYVFGDEGGGFDITRRALRAALRMEEGWGPQTQLHAALLHATKAADANSLLHLFYTPEYSRQQFAALATIVSECARNGDEVARNILRDAAAELASYVRGVHSNLFAPRESTQVAYIGGVFQSPLLRNAFIETVEKNISCTVSKPLMSPAAGAVLTALRLAGNLAALSNVPESDK